MTRLIVLLLTLLTSNVWASDIVKGSAGNILKARVVSEFENPWAMTFLNKEKLLVTTKAGKLWLVNASGEKTLVDGVPEVFAGGQGGLGDIVLHPNYTANKLVYMSYVTSDNSGKTRYAVVIRGELELSDTPFLKNIETIWKQAPAIAGKGHFSHRLLFGLKGTKHAGMIFITSGDRQEQSPAQKWDSSLGKIIRLNEDGSTPSDNPFQSNGSLAKTFWTVGHRNALGISFDGDGALWAHEMGPKHGDELNLIVGGKNYGWPLVSEGNHYSGVKIPVHKTRPEFMAPQLYWIPTIAPSGLFFYEGNEFSKWNGNAFIGGLKSRAMLRISFINGVPYEAERFSWSQRVREVEMSFEGAIWVLEDGRSGRLIQFTNPDK